MIDKLIQLVRERSQDEIVKNPSVPNQYNEAATKQVAESILGEFTRCVEAGRLGELLSVFQGGQLNQQSPLISNIIKSIADNFSNKFEVGAGDSAQIAHNLVPDVINQLIKKVLDPSDNRFNFADILEYLQGVKGNENLAGLLSIFGCSTEENNQPNPKLENLLSGILQK